MNLRRWWLLRSIKEREKYNHSFDKNDRVQWLTVFQQQYLVTTEKAIFFLMKLKSFYQGKNIWSQRYANSSSSISEWIWLKISVTKDKLVSTIINYELSCSNSEMLPCNDELLSNLIKNNNCNKYWPIWGQNQEKLRNAHSQNMHVMTNKVTIHARVPLHGKRRGCV